MLVRPPEAGKPLAGWIHGYKMQDTRYKMQDTRYKMQDTRYKMQDTRSRMLNDCPFLVGWMS